MQVVYTQAGSDGAGQRREVSRLKSALLKLFHSSFLSFTHLFLSFSFSLLVISIPPVFFSLISFTVFLSIG